MPQFLLSHVLGIDVSLSGWTLVESTMYLSAACLIGLRPLLSKSSQWFKAQISMFDFKGPWRRSRSGNDHRHEMGSMRQDLSAGVDGRKGHGQDVESGRGHSLSSTNIHVPSV